MSVWDNIYLINKNDSRKEPKKLQKEGAKEEGVSPSSHPLTSSHLIINYSAHSFARKEWYNVHVPTVFDNRTPTLTPCNKTAGQSKHPHIPNICCSLEIAADSLRGRVFEVSLADLNQNSNDQAWRKMKVQIEEVKGFDCYTNFYGMDITRDKLCTLVKKWHTLIEAFVQTKTADGYLLRMFAIAFTQRTKKQVRATCYAKNS